MIALKNATAIQLDPPRVKEGIDIVVDGGTIVDVGIGISKHYRHAKTLSLAGKYVSPGIVCSHNHFYSALARGILARLKPSKNFVEILQHLWWKLDRALDEESLYYSGLVGALDAVKAGTTAVVDHNASPAFINGSLTTLKDGFEKVGLRGILCYEVTDRNGRAGMFEGIEESVSFCAQVSKESRKEGRLIEAAIGAHAPFTLSDHSMKLLAEAVEATGRGIHIHVAEDLYDVTHSRKHYRKDPVARLDGFGLLNNKSILVHGIHLSDGDIDRINKHDAFLAHNPRSNMNNGVGAMRKLKRVRNVVLGTDGIGADMFEEAKFAFFKNNDLKGPLGPNDIARFLQNGNELLGRYFQQSFGRIEKGYAADLVVYDYRPPTPLTAKNVAGHLLFGLSSRDVETVIVNGSIVYEDRQFPFEVETLYKEARRAAQRLWKKMDSLR